MSRVDFFERAVAVFEQGHFDVAAVIARDGISDQPESGQLWDILGVALWKYGENEDAISALETASSLRPLSPLAQIALASLYETAGKRDIALLMLDYLALPDSCPTQMLSDIAKLFGKMREHRRALAVCETLVDRNPASHQAYFGIAFYKARLGCAPSELIQYLSLAMDLAPEILTYRINLAIAWDDSGSPSVAYNLLKDVSPEKVGCLQLLRRMVSIFDRFDDFDRCWAFMDVIEARVKRAV